MFVWTLKTQCGQSLRSSKYSNKNKIIMSCFCISNCTLFKSWDTQTKTFKVDKLQRIVLCDRLDNSLLFRISIIAIIRFAPLISALALIRRSHQKCQNQQFCFQESSANLEFQDLIQRGGKLQVHCVTSEAKFFR